MLDINWNPSRRELRQFAAICLPVFAGLFGSVVLYRSGSWTMAIGIWAAALVAGAIGFTIPAAVRPLFLGLMAMAYPIGWTISNLLLAATYYLLFTPIGLTMRLFGHDPLERTLDRSANTYWFTHEPRRDPSFYFRQF